jgi:Ser/Thr protein kinase RdoA (MazF antagonist)
MRLRELGDPIPGAANLYPWNGGQVLKLHGSDAPAEHVRWLGRVDRELFAAGLPVPAVGELIEVEGRLGQVYERVEGPSVADAIFSAREEPEAIMELARSFAGIHASVHAAGPLGAFDDQQYGLSRAIEHAAVLPDDLKRAAVAALMDMPTGDSLCHGDFHPYNVILSPRGPIVIDWPNGHNGNPLEDVARTLLMLEGAVLTEPAVAPVLELFSRVYRERYFELRPHDQDQLEAWRPIVAAVRLTDRIPGLDDWLVEQVRSGLRGAAAR